MLRTGWRQEEPAAAAFRQSMQAVASDGLRNLKRERLVILQNQVSQHSVPVNRFGQECCLNALPFPRNLHKDPVWRRPARGNNGKPDYDRVEGDEIQLTHEFMSVMLGVRRPSVSETLQGLKDRGLITYSRGKITVLDRQGLEEGSCECYRAVRDEHDRLLGEGD